MPEEPRYGGSKVLIDTRVCPRIDSAVDSELPTVYLTGGSSNSRWGLFTLTTILALSVLLNPIEPQEIIMNRFAVGLRFLTS